MSLVTILWSMGAAMALTLAAVYGATWLLERRLVANLFLCIFAVATALCARCEVGMMHSATPAEFGDWVRWYHVPLFFIFLSLGLFVRFYLGGSRAWLLWIIMSLRAIFLVVNLSVRPNASFLNISHLRHVDFLGESVTILGPAVLRSWVWLARTSLVLAVVYVLDAAVAAWRRGDRDLRRKAVVVLVAVLGPSVISTLFTQLSIAGLLSIPYLDTPASLITLTLMAFELSRDTMLSFRTRLELAELRANLAQVGRVSLMGQLASAIAHELNQPLGAILRNTDVAELDLQADKPDLQELRSIVADSGKAVRRAKEIIDRMRTLIQRRRVEMRPLAVDDLVRDVMSLSQAEAAAKQVVVTYATEGSLPAVCGDRVHISQVLLNLIVNAIEAVQGAPVGDRLVFIEARLGSGQVELAVRDSGPGIPPGDLDRVFEPLFSTKSGGLGMGLAICRTIVEAHGGRLWAEHRAEGSGATFRFVLPQAKLTVS
jgi:signal transduction histidine kinase